MKNSTRLLAVALLLPPTLAIASLYAGIHNVTMRTPGRNSSGRDFEPFQKPAGKTIVDNKSVKLARVFALDATMVELDITFDEALKDEARITVVALNDKAVNIELKDSRLTFASTDEDEHARVGIILPASLGEFTFTSSAGRCKVSSEKDVRAEKMRIILQAGSCEFDMKKVSAATFETLVQAGKMTFEASALEAHRPMLEVNAGKLALDIGELVYPFPLKGAATKQGLHLRASAGRADIEIGTLPESNIQARTQAGSLNLDYGDNEVRLSGFNQERAVTMRAGGPLIDLEVMAGKATVDLGKMNAPSGGAL